MKIKDKQLDRFYRGKKVPRKVKKALIGTKCSKTKLREKLRKVRIINVHQNGEVELNNYFCPKCGCEEQRVVMHYVEYPEVWNNYYCLRCGFKVAYEDNSPYIHCLEEFIEEREDE